MCAVHLSQAEKDLQQLDASHNGVISTRDLVGVRNARACGATDLSATASVH